MLFNIFDGFKIRYCAFLLLNGLQNCQWSKFDVWKLVSVPAHREFFSDPNFRPLTALQLIKTLMRSISFESPKTYWMARHLIKSTCIFFWLTVDTYVRIVKNYGPKKEKKNVCLKENFPFYGQSYSCINLVHKLQKLSEFSEAPKVM